MQKEKNKRESGERENQGKDPGRKREVDGERSGDVRWVIQSCRGNSQIEGGNELLERQLYQRINWKSGKRYTS